MPNKSNRHTSQTVGSQPKRSRPQIPTSYGIPQSEEGMLPWSHVRTHMAEARNYWVGTTRPDGRPHSVPVWGVWVDDVFYHGGGPDTRKARNLQQNPNVVVHLEDGNEVVIIEGAVAILTPENADAELLVRIDDAYEAKYGMRHGTPVWALQPRVALAWTQYPTTVTRWTFK